jgi:protein-disulfide isomerase
MAESAGGVKPFYLVLGAVAVVGVAGLAWLVLRPRSVSIPANVVVQPADTSGFHGYVVGSDSAPLTVTEFADYQCPFCQNYDIVDFPDVEQRLIQPGLVRWVYRDFPLSQHRHSRDAAHAAACAADQGKYWPMHHRLYQGQTDWSETGNAGSMFRGYAREVGLDLQAYDACMNSAKYAGRIQAEYDYAVATGVNETPTLMVNGRLYPADQMTVDRLKQMADSAAAGERPGSAPGDSDSSHP